MKISFKTIKDTNTVKALRLYGARLRLSVTLPLFHPFERTFSSSSTIKEDDPRDDERKLRSQRIWKYDGGKLLWKDRVVDTYSYGDVIPEIQSRSGKLRTPQLGVLHEDPATDMQLLTKNYTIPVVASALRDREDALQKASVLAAEGKIEELLDFLQIFHPKYVLEKRLQKQQTDVVRKLDKEALEVIRKALMRMPRTVTSAHSKRAAVVIPLCLVDGVPSLLLEKRARHMRNHPDEVCLPGGMVCEISDRTIVNTCLREMKEEIGGLGDTQHVLGVFRCNWGEVHHLVGVAVTPVVCFIGELPEDLQPNPDEVAEVFTLPLVSLLDKSLWIHKEGLAPIFVGAPHAIFGLTGYILEKFGNDILRPNSRVDPDESEDLSLHH